MKHSATVELEKTKARFVLDKVVNEHTLTFVMLMVSCEDGRLKYTTGQKTLPRYWNYDSQRSGVTKVDKKLNTLQSWVDSYFIMCDSSDTKILKDNLRRYVMGKEGKSEKKKFDKGDFFTGVDQIIDLAEKKIITYKKRAYSPGTLRNWRKTRNTLFEFDRTMSFEKITIQTYESFILWCNKKTAKNGQLYSYNYIGALIKDWKTLMELALERGYHTNRIHRDKTFVIISEKPHKIDLNDDEIQKLTDLELTGPWEIIRDRFIINLYLGFRISDFEKLTEAHIKGDLVVVSVTEKTGSSATMDLDPEIIRILAKYEGKLPKQFNRNHVNREIKKIAKLAGIDVTIEYEETRGGEKILQRKPKHELISHHTCRRSAITNLKRLGFEDSTISKALGLSVKVIQEHYDLTEPEEAARAFARAKILRKAERSIDK